MNIHLFWHNIGHFTCTPKYVVLLQATYIYRKSNVIEHTIFYVVDSDMHFDNTHRMHCCVATAKNGYSLAPQCYIIVHTRYKFQSNTKIYYTKYFYGNMFRLYWVIIRPSKEQIQCIKIYSAFWDPKRLQ